VVAGKDLQVAGQTAAADKAQVEAALKNILAAQNVLRSVIRVRQEKTDWMDVKSGSL
jgi:hypothetical protein